MAAPRRATARVAALPARAHPASARRLLPSLRSVAFGLALLIAAGGAYAVARETSIFAVRTIDVTGGSPLVQAHVRKALAAEVGRSLVGVGSEEIERRVVAVPGVLSVRSDRAFPHTLRVVVTPERAVLLVRRGRDAWAVSGRGRVLRAVRRPGASPLPRLWLAKRTAIRVGGTLPVAAGGLAASVLAPVTAGRFPARVRAVRADGGELTLVLRSGLEVRLGDRSDLRLKLAVARRILLALAADSGASYVDVSVPERPVVGGENTKVAGTG